MVESYVSLQRLRTRPMQLADIPAVQAIDQLSFPVPWPRSAFRFELTENKQSLVRIATAGEPDSREVIVGVIVVWLILGEAHIATLSVHPEYRRRGIASRLLIDAMYIASRKGATTSTLEVRAGNVSARRLYEKFRFQVVGRRHAYYRDNNEDALIMTVNFAYTRMNGMVYTKWLAAQSAVEMNGGTR